MLGTDVHQHLWPEELQRELARRRQVPRLRRQRGEWLIEVAGEPAVPATLAAHDPHARAAALREDGVGRALLSLSCALGVETLPETEAAALIGAYERGVAELGNAFGWWAAAALRAPDRIALDAALDAGAVGLALPAGALDSRIGYARCRPLLERLEARDAPLFVHPGPAPWGPPAGAEIDVPAWWPALTTYVSAMAAAWHAFLAWGRPAYPGLRVVFAMLAGGAPLHLERLRARGGPAAVALDPGVFYDTSSYGPRAIDAMVRCVGIDQLVYGTDRPVVDGGGTWALGEAAHTAIVSRNPRALLGAARARAA